jgi:beta-glucosidase-like glycosyl hydrolase
MYATSRTALLLVSLLCSALAHGQATGREAFYRCKDASGKAHFGTSMPPQCTGFDTEVISQRGNVMRVIEGEATRTKRLEAEAIAAQLQKEKEEQALRDRVLIDTYLAVVDIERLRDQRLELVEAQLRVAEQHITTLKERIGRLREQSARFKPYSNQTNAPPLPDHIAEEIINTIKSIATDQATINIKRTEQETMTANFARDIQRFKELKGIK